MVTPTLPWAAVPVPANLSGEEISPNIPSKHILTQLEARFLLSCLSCLTLRGCALLSGSCGERGGSSRAGQHRGVVSTADWSAQRSGQNRGQRSASPWESPLLSAALKSRAFALLILLVWAYLFPRGRGAGAPCPKLSARRGLRARQRGAGRIQLLISSSPQKPFSCQRVFPPTDLVTSPGSSEE